MTGRRDAWPSTPRSTRPEPPLSPRTPRCSALATRCQWTRRSSTGCSGIQPRRAIERHSLILSLVVRMKRTLPEHGFITPSEVAAAKRGRFELPEDEAAPGGLPGEIWRKEVFARLLYEGYVMRTMV